MFQITDFSQASLKKLNDAITTLQQMAYDQNGAALRPNSVTPDKLSSNCNSFTDITVTNIASINETHQTGRYMALNSNGNTMFWMVGGALFLGDAKTNTMISGGNNTLYIGSGGDINLDGHNGILAIMGNPVNILNKTKIDDDTNINANLLVNGKTQINGMVLVKADMAMTGDLSLNANNTTNDQGKIRFNGTFQKCLDGTNWVDF